MPVWSVLTNLVVQVRAQSQRENSKLRTQLRRQMATAKELSQEVERLRSALVEHKQQREAAALRLADAERQVRRAVYAGRGTVFVPYEFMRHPGGKRQASNTAAVAHAGPDSGPPVIPGDIDNCGFSRSYVVACARTWAAPRGTRQTIIKLQPAVPAHCASDTTHSTQQPTPTVTRQSHISGNILKAAERAAVHSQQELQNTPGAMQIFVRALNARR